MGMIRPKEYWADIAWQLDRMYDGSDEQPYEPEEVEDE